MMRPAKRAGDRRHERIARELESRIRSGALRHGDPLVSEEKLGMEFKASRTVVREALQAMKAKGLLESRRGSGTYVTEPGRGMVRESLRWFVELQQDSEMFVELMDLRILVESHCARHLASGGRSLRAVVARLKAMEKSVGDLSSFAEEDIGFHLAIAKASGHSLFNMVVQAVLPSLGRRFAHDTYTAPQLAILSLREHQEILAALEARDPSAAERAMRRHLLRSRRHFVGEIRRCEI